MNSVSISGWVRSTPVTHRLGDHNVYSEFRLGLEYPEDSWSNAAVVIVCHGRLALGCTSLGVGVVVEVHGWLFAAPDLDASGREHVSVIADELGTPGMPTLRYGPANSSRSALDDRHGGASS